MSDKISTHIGLMLRYLLSGGIAAAVHFGLLVVLVEFFSYNPTLASAIGFIFAVLVNYNLQFRWTFAVEDPTLHRLFFPRYLMVTFLTLCLNTLLFWMMNTSLGLQYLYAQVIATGFVLIVNFVINRSYTFNHDQSYCKNESSEYTEVEKLRNNDPNA